MNTQISLNDNILTLRYGLVVVTFGQRAVEGVLHQEKWIEKYPDLFQSLKEESISYVILPGEIIYEIAGRDECLDDYWADPDGRRLYAISRKQPASNTAMLEAQALKKLSNQQALLEYGSYCLFAASDKGVGNKVERGLPSDHALVEI